MEFRFEWGKAERPSPVNPLIRMIDKEEMIWGKL